MQLLIARHAETQWNVESRIQGWTDSKLSETGTSQARALAERLRGTRLTAIYSSDLGRAMKTAQCVALWHTMEVKPMHDLRETSWGLWEGMTSDEIAQKHPEAWAKFQKRDESNADESLETQHITHVPGGETLAQASDRLNRGLDKIIATHGESQDTVLLMGHGGSLRFLITRAIGISPNYARRFHLDNTSLSEITITPGSPMVIKLLNDICHLIQPAK